MKFGIIKERKNPPDRRVVLSPEACLAIVKEFPQAEIKIESSKIRVFKDKEYLAAGFEVVDDVSDCDVLLGVKEVPIEYLIPNKKYFFFSHTIKKQPYNRKLLQAILKKNIELFDHEVITDSKGNRLVAFGRYAGIVGAYNGIRTFGLKTTTFILPKAETLTDRQGLIEALNSIQLPAIKIVLTGKGRVGNGAKEMLDAMDIQEVPVESYLNTVFDRPVYCQINVLDYNKRKDKKELGINDFFENAAQYKSDFMRFAAVSDLYIAGHFYGDGAPYLFTREDVQLSSFKIKVVADISCDIDGPIATTIRASTIADPIYGYDPVTEQEVGFKNKNAIAVMAVDNLPCELPKDASNGFGENFVKYVIPSFFNGDRKGILKRAQMTSNNKLTERYLYLQEYVE